MGNPVTSLDAGEIAEVDEGDFADIFDSKAVDSASVDDDTDHMDKQDIGNALNTWEVLYGDSKHTLGESASKKTAERKELDKAKKEKGKVTEQLLKATSVQETNKLEKKLESTKKEVADAKAKVDGPASSLKDIKKDIKKQVAKSEENKEKAREQEMDAKTPATSAAAQAIDSKTAEAKSAAKQGASAQDKIINKAETAMSQFLSKPRTYVKTGTGEKVMVELKPKTAADAQQAEKDAKIAEATADQQKKTAENDLAKAAGDPAKVAVAKKEMSKAESNAVKAKVKEQIAKEHEEGTDSNTVPAVAQSADPNNKGHLIAPLQKLAKE